MAIVRWEPAGELASMEIDRLNRMFTDFYGEAFSRSAWVPAVDIYETDAHEVVLKAELPEMKREDINVTFEHNVLTLTGDRKTDVDADNGAYHRNERFSGKFTRSFTLPVTVDGNRITAAYKDGVLTIRVPQREEARPKQIEVGE